VTVIHLDPTPQATSAFTSRIFRFMDRVYFAAGCAAGLCLALIFAVTMAQVAGRLVGYNPPGLTDYAGYLTAASTFLGLAYALNQGGHVRVTLFLGMMGAFRAWVELASFLFSAVVACWFAYHSWVMVVWSYSLGDMSSGLDATALWIPQLSMACGMTLLAIAVIDHSIRLIVTGDHGIVSADEPL
jgi:TRAP-type C4-dicarboxylate transport system permease small subunit